jgi:hypothetical protein
MYVFLKIVGKLLNDAEEKIGRIKKVVKDK